MKRYVAGLDSLGYHDHTDYEVHKKESRPGSTDFRSKEEKDKVIVKINIFRNHRQTIQYIAPADGATVGQAELVVIDEAAAIPLPLVKQLIGPYLVFMASTINGYEGTGR